MHGKVLTVRHQAVNRRKDNRFAVALDSEQNNIHVKDIVKVIDGPHLVSKHQPVYLSIWNLQMQKPPSPSDIFVLNKHYFNQTPMFRICKFMLIPMKRLVIIE